MTVLGCDPKGEKVTVLENVNFEYKLTDHFREVKATDQRDMVNSTWARRNVDI